MKSNLRIIAVVSLVAGLGCAGLGAWLYFHARSQANLSSTLQEQSFDLEERSDKVKGTPEEKTLLTEAQRVEREAGETLASAKSNSQRAVILGVASILLILASIAMMMMHVRKKQSD